MVGVGVGCGVSVGAVVSWIGLGSTVGVGVPEAAADDLKGVYRASSRVSISSNCTA